MEADGAGVSETRESREPAGLTTSAGGFLGGLRRRRVLDERVVPEGLSLFLVRDLVLELVLVVRRVFVDGVFFVLGVRDLGVFFVVVEVTRRERREGPPGVVLIG